MPSIQADDGTRLCYNEWGTSKPVIFVSAWALGGAIWEYQMGPLSDRTSRGTSERAPGDN
jgi:non-heme chloroperoxidase